RLHRLLDVRDDDELRIRRHGANGVVVATYVGLIERGVNLVEDAERRRLVLEDCKDQSCGRERLLSAAHQLDVSKLLARRLSNDVDACIEKVIGVSELELSAATLEQTSERLLEQVVDDVEGFLESLFAFPIHVPDSAIEFGQCSLD